eukprot:TRINITY_DN52801_c0_g1_i1.p1 TRINITY_DN52801_c0_g1~~TRINITY_DN52801_c0_g1_i1.p1  ORF type:complete len:214 (-),score=37.88 TRINITY_DN52801_c0_g1_i1:99-740(-)
MIQATKATVITDFHQQTVEVRNMELEYYLMVFDKLSSMASVLAGFASSALETPVPERTNPFMTITFLLSTACALGAHLLVVIVTTMCTMWGPGHALRGQDASYVDNAVFILEKTKKHMEKFFFFGLLCYWASSMTVVCLLFDYKGKVTVMSIFVVMLIWLPCKISRIRNALIPEAFVSGHIKFNRVKNIGELMGSDGSLNAENGVSAAFATNI